MTETRFSRERITDLLGKLSDNLAGKGLRGEILLFGGAAMILGWNARDATRDVDAVFVPPDQIRAAAAEVGRAENIPADWLNDAVKGFLDHDISRADRREILHLSNLAVYVPPIEYLIATKAFASRSGASHADAEDLKFLIRTAGYRSADAILKIVEEYYPTRPLPAKVQFFVQSIFEELYGK